MADAGRLAAVILGTVAFCASAHGTQTPTNDPFSTTKLYRANVFAETAAKPMVEGAKKMRIMLHGFDPVAYFKQGKAVRGKASIMSAYHGVHYFFATEADKKDFDQNPSKFEPQYGGFCANNLRKGKLKDSDPRVFFIYKGKLYVCSDAAAGKEFYSNPDANIKTADKNWVKIGERNYNAQTGGFEDVWPFGPETSVH